MLRQKAEQKEGLQGFRRLVRVYPQSWPGGPTEDGPGRLAAVNAMKSISEFEPGQINEVLPFPDDEIGMQDDWQWEPESTARLACFAGSYGSAPDPAAIEDLLKKLGVKILETRYAAFLRTNGGRFRDYIVQLRLVTRDAVHDFFGVRPEDDTLPVQPITLGEAVQAFVRDPMHRLQVLRKCKEWPIWAEDSEHSSCAIGFGLLVEERRLGVYRIWSRLWIDYAPP